MPLTAAEVRATQFATTRVRSGYDVNEVDTFLDVVETDISTLGTDLQLARGEVAVLRTQYDQLQARLRTTELELAAARDRADASTPAETSHDTIEIMRPGPALFSGDAAEVMKIAQATADEIIGSARKQAQGIRTDLRTRLEAQLSALGDLDAADS